MSEYPEFQPPSPEEIAVHFPGYDSFQFIDAGGMGAVYLARQVSLNRKVAIKILPREFGDNEEFREGFQVEAKMMAKLNHPNLIGVYDFGDVEGMLFIVMEFIEGKSLYHSANGKAIDPRIAGMIASQVCRGLAHAHGLGVIHRDVKPANILLDPNARPRLGDFGLARPVTESEQEGMIFGTPGYTAPEVTGDPNSVDQRSDIFAIGVILYELLTARLPEGDFVEPSQICGCDKRWDIITRKAIAPDASLRYDDAAKLAQDIEAVCAGRDPINAVADGSTTPQGPRQASIKKPALAAGVRRSTSARHVQQNTSSPIVPIVVVAVLLIGGLIGFKFLKPSQKTEPPNVEDITKEVAESVKSDGGVEPVGAKTKRERAREHRENKRSNSTQPEGYPDPIAKGVSNPVAEEVEKPENSMIEEPEEVEASPAEEFDHMAFLGRGRKALRQSAISLFRDFDELKADALDQFRRNTEVKVDDAIARIRRRQRDRERGIDTDEIERLVRDYLQNLEDVPLKLPAVRGLRDRELGEEMKKVLARSRKTADGAQEVLAYKLQPIQRTYSNGVKKQAQALDAAGDESGRDILNRELELIDDMDYFIRVMRGEDLDPAEQE